MSMLPAPLAPDPVGRRQLSRETLSEHQREPVLTAAIGVFAKRGYPATTVDHIVAAARIGVGRFYALFASKEDCFLAAWERTVAQGWARIEAAVPDRGSQPERVLAVLAELLELIAAEPLGSRLVLVEAQTAGPKAIARHEEVVDTLAPQLRRCREASPFGAELPDSLEVVTLGGVVSYLQQRILRGEAGEPAARLPELVEIVLDPYLGSEQTTALLAARQS